MPRDNNADSMSAFLLSVTIPTLAYPPLGDWHRRGLCAAEDPDTFFPPHGDPGTKARQTCTACPVRTDCLDYATEADEFGIWGGLDQQQRRSLKRKQRRNAAARDNQSEVVA